jgi:hypothetical protein
VLFCNNSEPCAEHIEQAAEFFSIFMSDLTWCDAGEADNVWAEIDGFCEAKVAADAASALSHITAINQIIQGVAASAWHKGNQAGKRAMSSIAVVDMDAPVKG